MPRSMLLLCSCFALSTAAAQSLEPRQYSNVPVGLNFLIGGAVFSDGEVLFDPAVALENASIEIQGPLVAYARGIGLAGKSAKIDAGIARVCLDGSAEYQGDRVARSVCGTTDASLRVSVNLLGAPAYRLSEFGSYRQDLVVGVSVSVTAPTGNYDPERLVNIGTNRWSAKAELGLSKVVRDWIFELALAGTFFQDNDEFFGGATRSQDSMVALQGHAVRFLSGGVWLALDATHYGGGRTDTNGVSNANRQSNSRIGITASVPVNASNSVKLYASTGVSTRTGNDFDTVGVAWQYRWGGGLRAGR